MIEAQIFPSTNAFGKVVCLIYSRRHVRLQYFRRVSESYSLLDGSSCDTRKDLGQ